MWRTFVVPVLRKQVALLRNSSGCCKASRFCSVECCSDHNWRSSITTCATQQHATTDQNNIAKAQNTIVGILLKLQDINYMYNGKQASKVEKNFPLVQSLLDHINRHTKLVKGSKNAELTICTPKTKRNWEEYAFGYKNICLSFEKWCYGVVVISSLISWHQLLSKDERQKDLWHIYDFVNVNTPLRVLPVNGPAKPVDPLDAAYSTLENAMAECTAVTENALAMRFSTLKLHEKALTYFKSASRKGNLAAHFNVGLCYEKGLGTAQDIAKAVSSYTIAASHGHVKAAFNLALIFLQGKHYPNRKADGLKMMEKAGNGGLKEAQRFLGLYYADDCNEHYDMNKSVHWLAMASEQNDAKAQYHLGICHEKGLGVARNMQKAKELYRRAADNGHAGAQYNYAVFYEYGLGGLSIDKHEALRWYNTAAENGNMNAKENLEALKNEMGARKGTSNLFSRLFSDIWISKQPVPSGNIIPRCLSSPDRLFMQSDLNTLETPQETRADEQRSVAYKDNKCVWVI